MRALSRSRSCSASRMRPRRVPKDLSRRPLTFADCFTALVEGALILRQTHARNVAARVVRPAVEQLIQAYLPSEAVETKSGREETH